MPVDEMLRSRVADLGPGGQQVLAASLGVSAATASRWVKGQLVPEEKWAPALARWLQQDESAVLASITLARKRRQEAKVQAMRETVESDEVRQLRQTVEDLATKLREVEARLDAAEQRRAPGESSKAARNKR